LIQAHKPGWKKSAEKIKTMKSILVITFITGCLLMSGSCKQGEKNTPMNKMSVILDTDTNNELDDQHAIAYLLCSGDNFSVKGITVNATYNGGNIDQQYAEAERIVKLLGLNDKIPILKGADGNFESINGQLDNPEFDGDEAVNFIVEQARRHTNEKLVLIAVGKLTNVALAVKKEPAIIDKIRLVWLGSNYPEPGEYNLENDIPSVNYLLQTNIPFEIVTVRYGKPSGTDAVRVTQEDVRSKMAGLGPKIKQPVTGRHGGEFYNFGDYSVDLFKNAHYYGTPPSRALFDMAAVAIVKNAGWALPDTIPCPVMIDNQWKEQPGNVRKIIVWENFDSQKILSDFFSSLKNYVLVE
jgi:purine nucleosidase